VSATDAKIEHYVYTGPPFMMGLDYKFIVESEGMRSDADGEPGLGFSLIPQSDLKPLALEERRLTAMSIGAVARLLLTASLFASYDLNAEALNLLSRGDTGQNDPEVLKLAGRLYLKIGLSDFAQGAFERALQAADDASSRASCYIALAEISETQGNVAQAINNWEHAWELYRQIGDSRKSDTIVFRIEKLKKSQ
jgi:tetratricopeptide (TPR) repeat protein